MNNSSLHRDLHRISFINFIRQSIRLNQIQLSTCARIGLIAIATHTVCLPFASAQKTIDVSQYRRPLLFAPKDNGIQLASPQMKWEFKEDKVDFSGLVFDSTQIQMRLSQTKRDDTPGRFTKSGRKGPLATHLSFSWQDKLTTFGKLSIVQESGTVLYTQDVKPEEMKEWKNLMEGDSKDVLNIHRKSQFGIFDADLKDQPFLNSAEPFRFCFSEVHAANEKMTICSQLYQLTTNGDAVELTLVPKLVEPTLLIGEQDIGTRGLVNFDEGKAIQVMIRFRNGATIEFSSKPLDLELQDVIANKDNSRILIIGQGPKPVGKVKDLVIPPNHFFSATGLKEEVIWQVVIPYDTPLIKVTGAWGVPFTYLFSFEQLPKESDRVYVSQRSSSSSYSDHPKLYGFSRAGDRVGSNESKVQRLNSKEFTWDLKSEKAGERNKSRLTIVKPRPKPKPGEPVDKSPPTKFVAHYQMFRGYPTELSLRFTGLISADLQIVAMGEMASSYWLENLGTENYYFSKQRWGASVRYYQAVNPIKVKLENGDSQFETLSPFSALNVDLKYNLIPGVWNRDELLGLIASAQVSTLGAHKTTNIGGGAYWARTMPKIFDDLFNLIPIFRYPKYVDMEFIFYPLSLTSGITPVATYQLNFHGKVFWTTRFYGEAGFGLKAYNFDDVNTARKPDPTDADQTIFPDQVRLSTFYGTVGIGVLF